MTEQKEPKKVVPIRLSTTFWRGVQGPPSLSAIRRNTCRFETQRTGDRFVNRHATRVRIGFRSAETKKPAESLDRNPRVGKSIGS